MGCKSIVLYDSAVGENTFVDALSLIMKGEHIPANTEWRGVPAEPIARASSCNNNKTNETSIGGADAAAEDDELQDYYSTAPVAFVSHAISVPMGIGIDDTSIYDDDYDKSVEDNDSSKNALTKHEFDF